MDAYYFDFDPEKNAKLRRERNIDFEAIIALIATGHVKDIRMHHNQAKYPHQHVIEVDVEEIVYLVPCVITPPKIFLKTIYPSRKAVKAHRKGKNND